MAALRRMRRATAARSFKPLGVELRAIPLQAAYSGAKFAIRGFTDSLRVELLHDRSGVHVTMVHLPSVHTAQFDWGRTKLPWLPRPLTPVVKPEIAAEAIVDAIRLRKREVCVGIATLFACGVPSSARLA